MSHGKSARVLCYGEIGLDHYLAVSDIPQINRAAYVKEEFNNVGGAAANSAVWLANWGVPVKLIGHELGNDEHGKLIREQFAQYPDLDTKDIVYQNDYLTPRCQCLVTPDGERTFIMHWLDELRVSHLKPEHLEGIEWLNLDMAGPIEPRLHASKLAHQQDVKVLVNDIYEPDDPLLKFVDVLVLSASIIRTNIRDIEPIKLGQKLQEAGNCDVIITDADQPVTALLKNHEIFRINPPRIMPIDATGAGDIFKSGLLYGLVQGLPLAEAIRWGVAAGSVMTTRRGTTADPASLSMIVEMESKID